MSFGLTRVLVTCWVDYTCFCQIYSVRQVMPCHIPMNPAWEDWFKVLDILWYVRGLLKHQSVSIVTGHLLSHLIGSYDYRWRVLEVIYCFFDLIILGVYSILCKILRIWCNCRFEKWFRHGINGSYLCEVYRTNAVDLHANILIQIQHETLSCLTFKPALRIERVI